MEEGKDTRVPQLSRYKMRNPPSQASVALSSLGSFCIGNQARKTDGSKACHEYLHWLGATLVDVQGTRTQTRQTLVKTAATRSGSTQTANKDGALAIGRLLVAGSTASRLSTAGRSFSWSPGSSDSRLREVSSRWAIAVAGKKNVVACLGSQMSLVHVTPRLTLPSLATINH